MSGFFIDWAQLQTIILFIKKKEKITLECSEVSFRINAIFTSPTSVLELRDDGEVLHDLHSCIDTFIPILTKAKKKG